MADDDTATAAPMSLRDRIAALNSNATADNRSQAQAQAPPKPGRPPLKPKPSLPGAKPTSFLRSQTSSSTLGSAGAYGGQGSQGQSQSQGQDYNNGYGQPQQQQQQYYCPPAPQTAYPTPTTSPPSYYSTVASAPPTPARPALPPRLPPRGGTASGSATPAPASAPASKPPPPSLPPRLPPRTPSTPTPALDDTTNSPPPTIPRRTNTTARPPNHAKVPGLRGRGAHGELTGSAPGEAKRVLAPAWGTADLPPLPPKRNQSKPRAPTASSSSSARLAPRGTLSPPSTTSGRSSGGASPVLPFGDQGGAGGRGMVLPPVKSLDDPAIRGGRSPTASQTELDELDRAEGQRARLSPMPSRSQMSMSPAASSPSMSSLNATLQGTHLPASVANTQYGQDFRNAQTAVGYAGRAAEKVPPGTVERLGEGVSRLNFEQPPPQPPRPQGQAQFDSQGPIAPPPVPVASKPPVPLATRPKPSPAPQQQMPSPAPPISTGECMTCRDFSAPDTHAAAYPRTTLPTTDPRWLALELTFPFPSPTDKARALFTWLHHNIAYDVASFFGGTVRGGRPEDTLVSGVAVCDGYAGLFLALATHAGLEARKLAGHGKGFGYHPLAAGQPIPAPSSGHAWNAVRVDGGEWKLIDATWGAGHVNGDKTYSKAFHEEYFTMSNEEFSLKHFPLANGNRPAPPQDFYFAPGLVPPSWEEYIQINPDAPTGVDRPILYSNVKENHGIGKFTLLPAGRDVGVYQPGPVRFQFGLMCPHWSLRRHSGKNAPYQFIFIAKGARGDKSEYIAFHHVHHPHTDGTGDYWYVDVEDPTCLGPPGNKLVLFAVTSFGEEKDARGLSREEFLSRIGRVGMGFSGVAEWRLV